MNVLETKVQLHYRHLYIIFGGLGLLGLFDYFFYKFNLQEQMLVVAVWVGGFVIYLIISIIVVKNLTKKIVFFFGDTLSIEIFNLKTGVLEEAHKFEYLDIKSCLLSSGSYKTCTFKLYFFNRRGFKLVLYSAEGKFVKTNDIIGFEIFRKLHLINADIKPQKPFFITNAGNFCIGMLLILFVTNILIHIRFGTVKELMVSLPTSTGLILMVLLTRKRQQSLFNAMT